MARARSPIRGHATSCAASALCANVSRVLPGCGDVGQMDPAAARQDPRRATRNGSKLRSPESVTFRQYSARCSTSPASSGEPNPAQRGLRAEEVDAGRQSLPSILCGPAAVAKDRRVDPAVAVGNPGGPDPHSAKWRSFKDARAGFIGGFQVPMTPTLCLCISGWSRSGRK